MRAACKVAEPELRTESVRRKSRHPMRGTATVRNYRNSLKEDSISTILEFQK
jgi:hypothetical protein